MRKKSTVAAQSSLNRSQRRRSDGFRRRSTDAGITTDIVVKVETLPVIEGSGSTLGKETYLKELVGGFVDTIKAANNVQESVTKWVDMNNMYDILSADKDTMKQYFGYLAEDIKVPMKMARRGMAGSLLMSLACTYGDVISDAVMVHYYLEKNMASAFRTSLGILIGALAAQGLVTWTNTKHVKQFSVRIRRVVFGVISLNPAIHAYGKWTGDELEEGSTSPPSRLLGFTKFVELICESLPQLIVQLGFLLEASDSIQGDLRPIASIIFSVVAVGFIVSDMSIGWERVSMSRSIRGPYQTWWVGVLPERRGGVFFFGHVLFVLGYFACAVISFTAAGQVLGELFVFAFEFIELMCFLLVMRAAGRARWVLGNSNGVGLFDVLRPEWLVTSVVPVLLFRQEWNIGGGIWSRFIAWRLCVTTAAVYLCSSSIEADVMTIHMTALCCAVVGFLIMVVFASDSHRWTLYSTKMTLKGMYKRSFVNDNLTADNLTLNYTYSTPDELRLQVIATAHPYYYFEVQHEVKKWVLNMKVTDELFKEGVVPRGTYSLKGQTFATAFAIIKRKYSYFNDPEGNELIGKHLDSLLIEVENLNEEMQKKMQSSSSSPSPLQRQVSRELPAIFDKDAEIAALKRELEEMNAVLEEKDLALEEKDLALEEKDLSLEENKAAIEEKDKVIAALEERLRENDKWVQ